MPNEIRLLLSLMIPGDDSRGLPSGGSLETLTTRLLAGELVEMEDAAHRISAHITARAAVGLNEISVAEFGALIKLHRSAIEADMRLVGSELLKEYYTHPDVQVAVGGSSRPPFPNGFSMPVNNFELLEDVYNRGPIYREISYEQ